MKYYTLTIFLIFLFLSPYKVSLGQSRTHSRSTSVIHRSSGSHSSTYHSSGHISTGRRRSSNSSVHYTSSHRSSYASGSARDSHGRIKRSSKARHEFMKQTGYAHGRKGYVIDHIIPLKKGGSDSPSNMQWQTKEAAKAKDKWEAP